MRSRARRVLTRKKLGAVQPRGESQIALLPTLGLRRPCAAVPGSMHAVLKGASRMPAADVSSSLEESVLNADNLPTLPVVALKVLELTQLPEVSAGALAAVIQNDPALSAKLLKLANSSMFGMPRKIGSLQ